MAHIEPIYCSNSCFSEFGWVTQKVKIECFGFENYFMQCDRLHYSISSPNHYFPFFLLQHVQLIVKNALKLYSQDRTGLVDYALESGGKVSQLL